MKAFLYGSKARGDAEEFSDIDILLVIEAVTDEEEKTISHLSWEAWFENQALIMAVVYSREKFEQREDLPFLSNVKRGGHSAMKLTNPDFAEEQMALAKEGLGDAQFDFSQRSLRPAISRAY